MKKNRYAQPSRKSYADQAKKEGFKFKDKNDSNNMPKSKKKRKKPKSAG